MSKSSTLILLGVLIMLAPYSGLPVGLRSILTLIFGALVVGVGIWMRADAAKKAEQATPPAPAPAPANEFAPVPKPEPVPEPSVLEVQAEPAHEPAPESPVEPLAF